MQVDHCKSETCRAAIVWARGDSGKLSPYNAEPTQDGRWRLDEVLFGEPVAVYVPGGDPAGLYVSHFATCPEASWWRRHEAAGRSRVRP